MNGCTRSRSGASPPSSRGREDEDGLSPVSDTRHGANRGRTPTRNDASKDGGGATTRHVTDPSNAKNIHSTSTGLPPVGQRQQFRSPRRRATPGRVCSSLYLLESCQLTT